MQGAEVDVFANPTAPVSRVALAIFGLAGLAAPTLPAADRDVQAIIDGLQQERAQRGLSPLDERPELTAVARSRTRYLAGLPQSGRLSASESIEDFMEGAGLDGYTRVTERVDLKRGFDDPARAVLNSWRQHESSWSRAMAPAWDAVAASRETAADGFHVFVVVLLEDLVVPEDLRALERSTVDAVNAARQSHGLEALEINEPLANVARTHSEDMARRGYFGHEAPDGLMAEQRVRARRIDFSQLGENLFKFRGADDPVARAVEGWLESPHHRDTMLGDAYRETGVGVAVGQDGSVYVTQLFLVAR